MGPRVKPEGDEWGWGDLHFLHLEPVEGWTAGAVFKSNHAAEGPAGANPAVGNGACMRRSMSRLIVIVI